MSKFTEHLWSDLIEEHGTTIADTGRPEAGRTSFLRRPGVLAGSTLGLAVVGTAAGLLVGSGGGTPAAPSPLAAGSTAAAAAYTVSMTINGTVLVTINQKEALPQANAKLAAMGIHEQIGINMGPGPAHVSGPVTCTPGPGAHLPTGAPVIKVLVGDNGTEVISPGDTAGNTGVGTWHLVTCTVGDDAGNSGVG